MLLYKKVAMNVWTQVDGEYCTDISDLQANGMFKQDMVTLPDGTPVSFGLFKSTTVEGDTTHWTYNRSGTIYTIFND